MTNTHRKPSGNETSRIRKLIPDLPTARITPIQGSLVDYPLAELLPFLQQTRKTGQLALERGEPAQVATILVHEGRVVDARCAPLAGDDALLILVGWRHGRFLFLPGPTPEEGPITWQLPGLLLEHARRTDELQRILGDLPTGDAILHPLHQARLPTPTLSRRAWNLLTQINGQRSLTELLEGFNCPAMTVAVALQELFDAGLIATHPDTDFLAHIIVRRRVDPPGDGSLTDALLGLADGSRTLAAIAGDGELPVEEMLCCAISLIEDHWLEITAGEDEYLDRLAPEIPLRLPG